MTFKSLLLTIVTLFSCPLLATTIVTEEINYSLDGVNFSGYLAYDKTAGKRPGVLVVHEWWGHNDYARQRATMLAEEGFTALALDMYGDKKLASHPKDAKGFMMEALSNLDQAEARFEKAMSVLQSSAYTNSDDIAAIGYCFGGAVVLHMARAGKPLSGVISYHGSLGSMLAENIEPAIQAKIKVFTGAADPMVPVEQVSAFSQEMFNAGADFSVQVYPNAKHSFTNPGSTAVGKEFKLPLAYDKGADEDSWRQSLSFLKSL